jgi:hypothetical protein
MQVDNTSITQVTKPVGLGKADQIREQIASLESMLLASNPTMPTLLRTIHTALSKDKDIVTLLTEEEIGVLVRGLMTHSNTVIATAAVKKTTKSLKTMSLEDLM